MMKQPSVMHVGGRVGQPQPAGRGQIEHTIAQVRFLDRAALRAEIRHQIDERLGVQHRAAQGMSADRLGLFDDTDLDVAALLLSEFLQMNGPGQVGRPRTHEEHVEFQLFSFHVHALKMNFEIRIPCFEFLDPPAQDFIFFTASVTAGRIWKRSPTTPKSALEKTGASGSLLIATITLAVDMPARCWIAPEMPQAM